MLFQYKAKYKAEYHHINLPTLYFLMGLLKLFYLTKIYQHQENVFLRSLEENLDRKNSEENYNIDSIFYF